LSLEIPRPEIARPAAANRRSHIGVLSLRLLPVACLLFLVSACGGKNTEAPGGTSARSSPDAPVLTLLGSRVVKQPLGTKYVDAGATAEDPQEGDITSKIAVSGLNVLDVDTVGDYLVRYDVTDTSGRNAAEVMRIVRVSDGTFAAQSARPLGTTQAPMGYFEHLPLHYADDPSGKFPLIVWNHGWGHSLDFGHQPYELDVLANVDIFEMFAAGTWDDSRPFVVLMPQRSSQDILGKEARVELKRFVDYAVRTYNVDPSRLYMMGFSDGAGLTWRYIHDYPNQLAAAVPISGYFSFTEGCSMRSTPVWAFQAKDDPIVPWASTFATVDTINRCDPVERARFTLFPTGGHYSLSIVHLSNLGEGDPAYDKYEPDIYSWLLQHHR
jgi:predicted esterase